MARNLKSQSGAIMLEVIAVLSLMGLMGTMLFRQIYLRNQELHNIQMASEIRVIKDAFAAWIQSNSVVLASYCPVVDGEVNSCDTLAGRGINVEAGIASYLPDGYFQDSAGGSDYLSENYDFTIWGYYRGDSRTGDMVRTFYGVIVPKPNVLPDGGDGDTWNFRRAARVAMLIGIDGGAFASGITVDDSGDPAIVGAVGTWSIDPEGIITATNNMERCGSSDNDFCPTYVAITGLDIFQPEIELPDLNVRMDRDLDLALQNTHVYGAFRAGGSGDNCYTINHNNVTPDANGVYVMHGDAIRVNANCLPAFYVEAENEGAGNEGKGKGTVRVRNDLTVGQGYDTANGTPTTAAIRFDKSGMIVFEEKKVPDTQNGHREINYLLDPAYTSVMNDVKIMSRGGAKLSEILPRYILKEVKELSSSTTVSTKVYWQIDIPADYCPKGYKLAIVAQPTMWEGGSVTLTKNEVQGRYNTSNDVTISADKVVTDVELKGTKRAVYIGTNDCDATRGSVTHVDNIDISSAKTYYVCFGHADAGGTTFTADASEGIAYLYCVFNEYDDALKNSITTESDCKNAGFKWHGGNCYNIPHKQRDPTTELCAKFKEEGMCEHMGCKWNDVGNTCEMPVGAAPAVGGE